jgi:N-acylneuraminate cytidylyltransferase
MLGKIKKKRLAIIPARGGSKRIIRKNVKPFLGKPIILRVLDQVSASNLFTEIHVSTEDKEISELVSKAGYQPRFSRDARLAGDETPLSDVLKSVLKEYHKIGESFETVALIFATAVLIDHHVLEKAMEEFEKGDTSFQLLSVAKYPAPIEKAMRMGSDNKLFPVNLESIALQSNNISETYFETGDFVIYDEEGLMCNSHHSLKRGFLLPPWQSVDIDTEEDWYLAECFYLMNKNISKNK